MFRIFKFASLFPAVLVSFVMISCVVSPKEAKYVYLKDTNWADTNTGYTYDSNTTGVYTTLVWHDEFDGTDYDPANSANWVYDIGLGSQGIANPWGNHEKEYYKSENGYIYKGTLVIKAKQESYGGQNYTSARLKTKGLQSWMYGKIAARIQLPAGQGFWPAFWMLGTNIDAVGWPYCGENDIMENKGFQPTIAAGTLIFPNASTNQIYWGKNYTLPSGQLNTSYHVFELIWTSSYMTYSIDGVSFFTTNKTDVTSYGTWVFDKHFYILLNLAVGGDYGGDPDGSTVFPNYMFVDWVRVYQ